MNLMFCSEVSHALFNLDLVGRGGGGSDISLYKLRVCGF